METTAFQSYYRAVGAEKGHESDSEWVSELGFNEERQPLCEKAGSTIKRCLRKGFYYVCILWRCESTSQSRWECPISWNLIAALQPGVCQKRWTLNWLRSWIIVVWQSGTFSCFPPHHPTPNPMFPVLFPGTRLRFHFLSRSIPCSPELYLQ